ncbi:IPT/TIG domain-containing protein [Kitasatospora sp. NPDC089797]|uniref:IPT/TIG domain-containing protein n=1 Tax=Kitasatospora sp. NPDC089797 TaxID=3155298 RepID=UPI00342BA38F
MSDTRALKRPIIEHLEPDNGKVDQTIIIGGQNLAGVQSVTFVDSHNNKKSGSNLKVISNDEVQVTVPKGLTSGVAQVTVTSPGGTSTPPTDFPIIG